MSNTLKCAFDHRDEVQGKEKGKGKGRKIRGKGEGGSPKGGKSKGKTADKSRKGKGNNGKNGNRPTGKGPGPNGGKPDFGGKSPSGKTMPRFANTTKQVAASRETSIIGGIVLNVLDLVVQTVVIAGTVVKVTKLLRQPLLIRQPSNLVRFRKRSKSARPRESRRRKKLSNKSQRLRMLDVQFV